MDKYHSYFIKSKSRKSFGTNDSPLKQLFCNIEDLLVNEHDVFIVIHCSQSPFLSPLVLPEDSLHHGAAGVAQSVLS